MREFFRFLSSIPAFLGSVIPVFKACPPCPVCMPIYAGILSLLGLELAEYGHFVVPVMLISMTITIVSLWIQSTRGHRKQAAFWLALTGCSVILFAKFALDFLPLVYCGMACLITALVLNRRFARAAKTCCGHHHHCGEVKSSGA
ncbi:MAG: MerC domain-containing protein [Chlamydiia bacterium]|nr:MerC domain-containing protein [Chlamydiia bacterium]